MNNFTFKPIEFVNNLQYMGKGMLGIFIVICLLVLCCFGLNYFTNLKKNKTDGK